MMPAPTTTTSALSRMARLYPKRGLLYHRGQRATCPAQEESSMLHGRMMDFPLTITHFLERSRSLFGATEIVSRMPDRSLQRVTYAGLYRRIAKLANAFARLGVRPGDRIATLAWNHARHMELYFAAPAYGAVLHTL